MTIVGSRALIVVLLASVTGTSLYAQTATASANADSTPSSLSADTTPTIKLESNLVAVSAIVRDKDGKPISGLTRDAFVLKQDGRQQTITYFSQGSDLPLTLALMVDTSGSQRGYIAEEIAAGHAFFPAMLTRPDDRAVLVQFDSTVLQLVKLTSSATTLQHGLAYLTQSHDDIAVAGPRGGGTLLYDAIVSVSRLALGNQLGRRAMVILTDGGDNGSRFKAKDAIRAAQGADIMIYSVYYSNGGGNIGALNDLSKATGGRVFTVSPQQSLPEIYGEIAQDMRQQYELGYVPPASKPDKYHKIDLAPKDKGLTVQAREGYYTPKQ